MSSKMVDVVGDGQGRRFVWARAEKRAMIRRMGLSLCLLIIVHACEDGPVVAILLAIAGCVLSFSISSPTGYCYG